MRKPFSSVILGAAFLMATSAIGPGFLTQTAVFTGQLAASFGFVILLSVLLDIGAQLNIWTVLCVSGKKAQDLANGLFPGMGYVLSLLVVFGGLAFNIGNLAGCGLGLEVLTGMSDRTGAVLSGLLSIGIFLTPNPSKWMDHFTKLLGVLMIGLTLYVCFTSSPPLAEALHRSFIPERIDAVAIITLVGGTVGGYISFAGAHRLLEEGYIGESRLPDVQRSAVSGILLASTMRVLLFLAALGVVSKGLPLQENNPAASVFKLAAGPVGFRLFGIVMWCAAVTSVVGSAYTSYSFVSSLHPVLAAKRKHFISLFILLSAGVYVWIGKPVKVLVMAGTLNGFILPVSLILILLAAWRMRIEGYRHPNWLFGFGLVVIATTLWLSIRALAQ